MHNKELIEKVEQLKSQRIIKRDAEIAASTGFSKTVISNYLSGRVKSSENFNAAFEKAYNTKIFENFILNEEVVKYNKTSNPVDTINSLVESNKILASNNTVIAESQLKLVETNSELAGMLKEMINKTNSSDLSGIQRASAAKLAALLEVIADLGIGKGWKSKQEGLAYLSKKFYKDLEAV